MSERTGPVGPPRERQRADSETASEREFDDERLREEQGRRMGVLGMWHRVRVSGHSMTPTLRDGDVVLVRYGAVVRPGDLVLARFRVGLELLVLKRAVRAQDDGWVLASDNARAGSDSAQYGVADVHARVWWIWHRRLRGGRGGLRSLVRTALGHRPHRQPPDRL